MRRFFPSRSTPAISSASLLFALSLAPSSSAKAQQSDPQKIASTSLEALARRGLGEADRALGLQINIEAKLDVTQHRLSGEESIRFIAPNRLNRLYLHLYLNAFRDENSLFRQSSKRSRSHSVTGEQNGFITISEPLLKTLRGDFPLGDVKNAEESPENDFSDVYFELPSTIEAGEELILRLKFDAQLPELQERSGYVSDFHFIGQWYPKLAFIDGSGVFRHFPFHSMSEFFSNFASYDVELEVPKEYVVGATGKLLSSPSTEASTGVKRYHYIADNIHDFAWTAWTDYSEKVREIKDIRVQLLYPQDEPFTLEESFASLEFCLNYFEKHLGPYPYSDLSIVHPPVWAAAAGGMEYPQLLTTGSDRWERLVGRSPAQVIIHELAHQWFYGTIATDEESSPFLDEGFSSYWESRCAEAYYQERPLNFSLGSNSALARIDSTGFEWYLASPHLGESPSANSAPNFKNFEAIGALVYFQSQQILKTLERSLGRERWDKFFWDYATRFQYSHPTPEVFYRLLAEHFGEAIAQSTTAAFEDILDWDPKVSEVSSEGSNASQWRNHFRLERSGNFNIPIDVELEYSNNEKLRIIWFNHDSEFTWEQLEQDRLLSVRIDPENKLLIDKNRFNNISHSAEPRWFIEWLIFATTWLNIPWLGGL